MTWSTETDNEEKEAATMQVRWNSRVPQRYLKSAFKFSGSSARPAYPGFIVMKSPTLGVSRISSPMKLNIFFLALMASWMHLTWTATTDNTSTEMRLNSSKQPQAPDCARPL